VPVECTPESGSTFPIGVTTVECTATDAAGNIGRASFTVTVNPIESPRDNGKIAFASTEGFGGEFQIFIMNPDGSEQVNISNNLYQDDFPDWSPDGTKIVFSSLRPGVFGDENRAIWVMNADGSEQRMLIDTPNHDTQPSWSPDGTKIAFVGPGERSSSEGAIYVMNADGSGETRLTNDDDDDEIGGVRDPVWSPDGTKIAFVGETGFEFSNRDIFVMNADGSEPINISNNGASDLFPDWGPAAGTD
jgi:Tol biopolymer transport system component